MVAKLYVAVPVLNRKRVVELCLPTMAQSLADEDALNVHNDGSVEFTNDWLATLIRPKDTIYFEEQTIGIEAQRRMHLAHFWHAAKSNGFTHLVFSDCDMLMDGNWRSEALRLLEKYDSPPLCMYDTEAHVRLAGNLLEDKPESEVIWRKYAPGVSYILTVEHVRSIMPYLPAMNHFDWQIPNILGNRFAISRASYCEHLGFGGLHHRDEYGVDGGDRARNPTSFLIEKRAEVVKKLSTP